ncbi:7-cyano-7-deazaguanine synthase [Bacillus sp. FJAT-29814]|uniref:7-cyano-7-deazaguanine synthase n=1 Tax=Bacillus sp. FJAT-29814 TaxID=1729688 RepID=UPI0008372DE5|nr:7-cyano-7-deazaguanine synthase [Bacillus sp. FJAT-29814]
MALEYKFLANLHKDLLKDFSYNDEESNLIPLDFVTIMGSIYCADIYESKVGDRPRTINLDIPLFRPNIWENAKRDIEQLANWVSGDEYNLSFYENKLEPFENITLSINSDLNTTLFSGGLDSLSGAFFNYKNGVKSDYIGFINKNEEATRQRKIAEFYRKINSAESKILLIDKPNLRKNTYTQATRSLLYMALAVANAFFNNSNEVYLYENGILSLNPEISGRFTTKTTHPKTIYMYNNILFNQNFDIKINHPFMFETKGQIIDNMDKNFKSQIKYTFTCGQSRTHPERIHKGQCGICIPCLLRKISIAAYDNEEYDDKYYYDYNIKYSDITEIVYRKDYESNIQYFMDYFYLIREKRIHLEMDVKKEYYQGIEDYLIRNKQMLEKFSNEFERFLNKYDPN